MKTHTDKWPYVCSMCSAPFHQKGALERHMKMHQSRLKSSYRVRNSTQETVLRPEVNGTDNDTVFKSQASLEEANHFQLHSSKDPIIIHIKTE